MLRRLVVVLAVLVAAWLVACAVLFVWPSAETGAPKHADAIVVLSGDQARLVAGERLARDGTSPVLLISSVSLTPDWRVAKSLCRAGRYATARVLCVTAHPYSTRGEAETFSALARRRGWRSLVVVSSTYHLTRASILFRRCWNGPLWFVGVKDEWWLIPYNWATETGKLIVQETVERDC